MCGFSQGLKINPSTNPSFTVIYAKILRESHIVLILWIVKWHCIFQNVGCGEKKRERNREREREREKTERQRERENKEAEFLPSPKSFVFIRKFSGLIEHNSQINKTPL